MLEFYDACPYPLGIQEERLEAARSLSYANIECLVYGEDALAFIHFVPTCLFTLNLVVADKDLERATCEITRTLPYSVFTGVDPKYADSLAIDTRRTRMYTKSVYLKRTVGHSGDEPEMIFVHPESQLYLDVRDYSRSVSLPPFPDNIRFPTRPAFLDSLIDTSLDPSSGRSTSSMIQMFQVWISYLILYTLRKSPRILPNSDLEPECAEVIRSLKPENQAYFEACAHHGRGSVVEHIVLRKEVLKRLGRFEEAQRPLPHTPSGNPGLLARVAAQKAASQGCPSAPAALRQSALGNKKRPFSTTGIHAMASRMIRLIR